MLLKRVAKTADGVFGVLLDCGIPFALTCEPEDKNNAADISCIPPGQYTCKRVDSPHFGDTFEITDVPARTHVLFHKGNIEDNTKGCVLVGEQFEYYKGKVAVLASKKGYGEFMRRLKDVDEFTLKIEDV